MGRGVHPPDAVGGEGRDEVPTGSGAGGRLCASPAGRATSGGHRLDGGFPLAGFERPLLHRHYSPDRWPVDVLGPRQAVLHVLPGERATMGRQLPRRCCMASFPWDGRGPVVRCAAGRDAWLGMRGAERRGNVARIRRRAVASYRATCAETYFGQPRGAFGASASAPAATGAAAPYAVASRGGFVAIAATVETGASCGTIVARALCASRHREHQVACGAIELRRRGRAIEDARLQRRPADASRRCRPSAAKSWSGPPSGAGECSGLRRAPPGAGNIRCCRGCGACRCRSQPRRRLCVCRSAAGIRSVWCWRAVRSGHPGVAGAVASSR
mmetsp:Transcript_44148/g.127437  ORF Transcript_44148/g.127437 Transcript_44148/m.127437 type:complete len:328 (-) Transcript_44148:557-1540(-)